MITERKTYGKRKRMHIHRNCDSKIEKSEASFEVENQKSENAQALNKNSRDLKKSVQFKEGNTEDDNFA